MAQVKSIKGTHDILPNQTQNETWTANDCFSPIQAAARRVWHPSHSAGDHLAGKGEFSRKRKKTDRKRNLAEREKPCGRIYHPLHFS